MDNFYNSVELSEKLLERKLHTFGTLRSFRGKSPEIRKPKNLAKHGVLAKDNGKVVVMVYTIEDRNLKAPVNDPIDRLRGGFKFHRLETYEHFSSTKYSQKKRKLTANKILLHKMQSSFMGGWLLLLPFKKKVLVIS